MSDKLQRYLDGELQFHELDPSERREAEAMEILIDEARQVTISARVPDLTSMVMARIEARQSASWFARAGGWLWKPLRMQVRPAYGAVAAALLIAVAVAVPHTPPEPGKVFVQFRIDAPQAHSVNLAGSFTGWKPAYALEQVRPGIWSTLVPLEPGVYNYAFVVNEGEWVADPAAPAIDDGFGGTNSRVSVLLPGS